jgi:hypothetical protein
MFVSSIGVTLAHDFKDSREAVRLTFDLTAGSGSGVLSSFDRMPQYSLKTFKVNT